MPHGDHLRDIECKKPNPGTPDWAFPYGSVNPYLCGASSGTACFAGVLIAAFGALPVEQ
jgi:hypothetical protein